MMEMHNAARTAVGSIRDGGMKGHVMLLILDLDETLVYSTVKRIDRVPDYLVGEYYVYCRPGLSEFLEFAKTTFDLAVWTSSDSSYAMGVVPRIFTESFRLAFTWSREQCGRRIDRKTKETSWIKDLRKVKAAGFRIENTLLIDDRPCALERDNENHVQVKPFTGQSVDNELGLLAKYLETIKSEPNVRTIEKRNWRLKVPPK